jgi:hypothetical protein
MKTPRAFDSFKSKDAEFSAPRESERQIAKLKIDYFAMNMDREEPGADAMLYVRLNNDEDFLIPLDLLARKRLFSGVINGRCGEPETDGISLYWKNGASLSLQDMFMILQTGRKEAG